jgi:phosphoribosylaminoimidazolecarboxamide formyltransferase/IMP cyclohydrolase
MDREGGGLTLQTRQQLAVEAFRHTSKYDTVIASFLGDRLAAPGEEAWPETVDAHYRRVYPLRYGENPHQSAAFYEEVGKSVTGVSRAVVHQGKELSFNNIYDLAAALSMGRDCEEPAACVIKHTNPCGLATAKTLAEAYEKALECDPLSAYGSIIGVNREVDPETARKIHESGFVEAMIAPGYAPGVLTLFAEKKSRRILELPGMMDRKGYPPKTMKPVAGGLLIQDADYGDWNDYEIRVVTERKPTPEEEKALRFAFKVAKHVKSNAIVLVQGTQTVGIGAGQMSRVDSTLIAIRKAGERAKGSVLGSDAFFPFRDGVDTAAQAGVTAIVQPGGSKRDDEAIAAANEHGIAMLFTGLRHFRH